jgi:hypothetical protein
MNSFSCTFDTIDKTITDHNSEEVTADTSPFWLDGSVLYFQSSSEDDLGTFYWDSLLVTFYVTLSSADTEEYLAYEAEVSAQELAAQSMIEAALTRGDTDMAASLAAYFGVSLPGDAQIPD